MSISKKLTAMKAAAFIAAATASTGAFAQFTPTGGGGDFGTIFRNLTAGLGSFSGLVEAIMYVVGATFALITLFKLYKWNKSDGREATLGGIGVTFLVAVLAFTMPMLINSGTTQLWGSGNVKTINAPQPSFR